MMNLFDIMQSAQHGQALPNLAQQYGLSLQQTQAALDALLPAFSMGLQRQTRDPYAFGSLAQMMTASPYARFFEAGGYGIPAGAQNAGNDVLSQLFGSREVSQAIAAQAAATSGVSQAILKQMLPVIAAMLMGGLSKTSSNEGLGGILGQFAEMMRGQMPGMQPAPQQPQMPANPFEAILKGMFGQGGQPQPNPQAAPPIRSAARSARSSAACSAAWRRSNRSRNPLPVRAARRGAHPRRNRSPRRLRRHPPPMGRARSASTPSTRCSSMAARSRTTIRTR